MNTKIKTAPVVKKNVNTKLEYYSKLTEFFFLPSYYKNGQGRPIIQLRLNPKNLASAT